MVCIKGPSSINADPVAVGIGECQLLKRNGVLETAEHGSLNVLSAKYEVS
jgi:hypothetical protein